LKYAFYLAFTLCACESAPRFAPLLIEASRPTRSLPAEQWSSTSLPLGLLPEVSAPSFTCLKVGPDGKTTMPPLKSGQSIDDYKDALVCLVALSAPEDHEQMVVQLRTGAETNIIFEGTISARDKQRKEHLVWISGKQWRALITAQKTFSLEVIFPCTDDEEGMGCELVLSQSFLVSPVATEARTEPKSVRGTAPKVSALQCGTEDIFGRWGEALTSESFLTEHFFCEVSAENPGDSKLENVSLELRGGISKNNSKTLATQLFPVLAPKEKVSYLFHASVNLSQDGLFVLSAAAGRNATERSSSQQQLTLKTRALAASLPSTQPTAPETD
jgi:hypothetical protein